MLWNDYGVNKSLRLVEHTRVRGAQIKMSLSHNRVVPLDRQSQDWMIVDGWLSVCSKSSRARLVALSAVENSDLRQQFTARSSQRIVLPFWVRSESLTGDNSLDKICSRGFRIGDDGFLLHYGDLKFRELTHVKSRSVKEALKVYSGRVAPSERYQHTLVLADVCIGTSLTVKDERLAECLRRSGLPQEFDSVVCHSAFEPNAMKDLLITATASQNTTVPFEHPMRRQTKENRPATEVGFLPNQQLDLFFKIFDSSQVYRFWCMHDCVCVQMIVYVLCVCVHRCANDCRSIRSLYVVWK